MTAKGGNDWREFIVIRGNGGSLVTEVSHLGSPAWKTRLYRNSGCGCREADRGARAKQASQLMQVNIGGLCGLD
jgi:hypothetical protein